MDKSQQVAALQNTVVTLADKTANPAPLGLLGFGMTTVLLNIHNTGFFGLNAMIVAMGIFYGGLAQVIAGIMEWKKNNTFGTAAFTSYGLFWLSLVGIWVLPKLGLSDAAVPEAMAAYLFMWGLFTLAMFVGTLRISRALQFVFGSLSALFFLLAISDVTASALIGKTAGIVGIICGFSAIYTAIAQILNELYGKTLLPIGVIKKK